jgi:hypothetical protein
MRIITASRPLILILAIIFLVLTALFLWAFGDWLRAAIVVPILYFFWLLSNILNSVDQQILWTLLFLLALAAIANAAFSRTRAAPTPLEEEGKTRGQGRVVYWLLYVNLMLKGVYHRSYFSEELKRLILSVLALHERQLPIEIEKRIISGDLTVPPQVLLLFKNPRRNTVMTFYERIYQTIRAKVKPNTAENRPEKIDDLKAVIAFIEEQMERK